PDTSNRRSSRDTSNTPSMMCAILPQRTQVSSFPKNVAPVMPGISRIPRDWKMVPQYGQYAGSPAINYFFFPHRAFAAFAAIWDRFRLLRDAALAAPPFSPPRRPKATAWGFLLGSTAGA